MVVVPDGGHRHAARRREEALLQFRRVLHRCRRPSDAARIEALYALLQSRHAARCLHTPAAALDPLGAMYVLRSIPLKTGERITLPICDDGTNYKILIAAGGVEAVQTGAGTIQAQQLTLTPQGANI